MSRRCSAKNSKGKRCGAWALTGAKLCGLHADPERAATMGSKHGRRVTIPSLPATLDLPYRSVKSRSELLKFLEETMNRVRQGPFDLEAKIMAVLAGIAREALHQGSARTSAAAKTDRNSQLFAKRRYLPDWPGEAVAKKQKEEREKRRMDLGARQSALPSGPEPTAEMGSRHGRKVTFSPPPAAAHGLPYRPLTNSAELIEFVEEAMNRERQGPFDLGGAKNLAVLAGILLKAVDPPSSTAATGQLYARRLYLPDWRRERIEEMQKEDRDNGTDLTLD